MTNHDKLKNALENLIGWGFNITGEEVSYEDDITPPTQSEIDTEIARMESPDFETEQWRQTFKVELYKLKIALDQIDDLESVETIISGQSKGVQLAWQNANTVRRNSPTVAGLAQEMEYTPEQLDTIFLNANQIQL